MATGTLTIDLAAIAANWRALDSRSAAGCETGAVVKADAYGLGAARVARALAQAGARSFFVALAEEGAAVRQALGPGPRIFVLSGHMAGDAALIAAHGLVPLLNSSEQSVRHLQALPGHPFGVQLDSGMNRLGVEAEDWASLRDLLLPAGPLLLISHLACADEPANRMNVEQLMTFRAMTDGIAVPRSLAATGGLLLDRAYHFDLTRPGIGLYGGLPFAQARRVVQLSLPVVQVRDLLPGESVGYGCTWTAAAPARIATVVGGYADGLHRALSNNALLWAGNLPCPLVGRVSMDLITVDVTHLVEVPDALDILGPNETVDGLAEVAGTIGYEMLTALGRRYGRSYVRGAAARRLGLAEAAE